MSDDALARDDRLAAVRAAAVHFLILTAYYALRPLRDALALGEAGDGLPWLFSATFVVLIVLTPVLGWLAARLERPRLVAVVDHGSAAIFVALFVALQSNQRVAAVAVFFVWLSVFTVVVLSLFWSVAADRFREAQARRLFGWIAAGGSAGALTGPALTILASRLEDPTVILIGAAIALEAAWLVGRPLWSIAPEAAQASAALGGGPFEGVREVLASPLLRWLALYLILGSVAGTFVYFEQGRILAAEIAGEGERTRILAQIDLGVNALALAIQSTLTAAIFTRFGVGLALGSVAVVAMLGFGALALAPTVAVVAALQITRRAAEFAVAKPARELLFTRTSRSERYKAKNFLDTVVFRGGDAIAGWTFEALAALGLGLRGIAGLGVPLGAIGLAIGLRLGRIHDRSDR